MLKSITEAVRHLLQAVPFRIMPAFVTTAVLLTLLALPTPGGLSREDWVMLTISQLRALEQEGLVNRTAFATIPPRVDYELTNAAYALKPIFTDLVAWSRNRKGSPPTK